MACRKMIEESGSVMGGQCRLNLPEGHDGPCASPDMQRSMRSRREWEETGSLPVERPQGEGAPLDLSGITGGQMPTLGSFQGKPETTAERYTDNATPVPGRDQGEPIPPGTVPTRPPGLPVVVHDSIPEGEALVVGDADAVKVTGLDYGTISACLPCQDGRHGWCVNLDGNDELKMQGRRLCSCYDTNSETHERWVDYEALLAMRAPSFMVASTSVPTKQRPEDQRLPEANDRPFAHDMVKADLDKRLAIGISRYGQGLQAFNGRNTLQDAYEEALDQTVYLQSLLVERSEMRLAAEEVYTHLSKSGGDPEVIVKARSLVKWLRQ